MGGALASVSKFKLGVVAATAAVAALSTAVAFKAVKSAADFQQAMAKVKAISGAVGQEFKALEDRAKELGKTTKFTMVEIADGMEVLARAGFEVNEILSAMAGVTALASSQAITLAEAGKMVATALRGMGLDITETERAVNLFAATASSAALNVHELSESFKMIAPLADILAISIEQVAAMIAAIGQVGIVGTQATATLRTAFLGLAKPSEDAVYWLDRLNMTMWDSEQNFIGLGKMIGKLEEGFKKLTMQEKLLAIEAIFNVRSSAQLLAMIKKGEEGFNKYVDSITDTIKAYEQQRIMLDTLSSRWTILQSSVDLLMLTLGTPSLTTLSTFTTAMTDVVNTITEWKEITNAATDAIGEAGDEAEAAEKKIVSLDDRILDLSGGMVNLKGVVYGVMNAVKLIWDSTMGIIVAAFKILIHYITSVIKLLQGDWAGVWKAQKQMFKAFGDYFTTVFEDIGIAFKDVIDEIKAWWSGMWEGLKSDTESFVNFFVAQINRIISLLNKLPFLTIGKMGLLELPKVEPTKPTFGGLPGFSLAGLGPIDTNLLFFAKTTEEATSAVAKLRSHFVTLEEALRNITPTAIAMAPLEAAKMLKDLAEKDFVAAATRTQELISSIETEIAAMAFFGQDTTEATERLNQFKKAMGIATETVTDISGMWSPLRNILGKLPGLMGDVATGLVDLAKGIVTGDIPGIITAIFNMVTAWIQDEIKKLEVRLDELRDILSFYTTSFKQIGSMLSSAVSGILGPLGNVLAGTIQLLTASIEMLRLDGIDLLRAGMTSLVGFVSTLIGTFSNLIQRSDAYGALQQESESVWKALGDVLGQFLWPLVAAIRYLKEWLGIQEAVNEQMMEIGVPTSWKRERRAYEAAAPGQIITSGVQVPSWAEALGIKLGETIRNVLEGFGISSWTELLTGVRDWAMQFWNWAIGNLPGWINTAINFLRDVWSALTAVYNWVKSNLGDLGDLGSVWGKFTTALDNLPSWNDVVSEIDKVIASIDGLKDTMKMVIAIAAGAIIMGIAGALSVPSWIPGGPVGGAIVGALAGGAIGAGIAGMFGEGGTVPGPRGSPQLIVAHGQETYTPPGQGPMVINEIRVFIGGRELDDVVVESVQRRGKSATGHRSTTAGLNRRY